MKAYIKPTVDIVELSVKENIAANQYANDYKNGITTYAFNKSILGEGTSSPA